MTDILNKELIPERLIGRRDELRIIEAAIDNAEQTPRCYYLVGKGGIGKTYLLHEIHHQVQERRKATDCSLLETGVIDLYHVRYHQPVMLMNALAQRLQTSLEWLGGTRTFFSEYEQAAQQYLRSRGSETTTESQFYERIRETFLRCYRTLANEYRVVVTIDTFEKLDPEIKQIEPFNFRRTSRLEEWLIDLIAELPNTLTILAGRPRPKQQQLLETKLGDQYRQFSIEPFNEAETYEYTQAVLGPAAPESERDHNIYWLSQGRPVVLILVLSCIKAGAFDIEALPPELATNQGEEQVEAEISQHFIHTVLGELHMKNEPLAVLLTQAAYLRKGLDKQLLLYLEVEGTDMGNVDAAREAELTELLRTFKDMPIVKITGDDIAILHDEIYDVLFQYDQTDEKAAPIWYERAVQYLQKRLADTRSQIRHTGLTPTLLQELHTNQVEYLFYRMAASPLAGYQDYRERIIDAILAHDEDFDTQLQDELARFYEPESKWGQYYLDRLQDLGYSWEQICYDESVHWVYRCLNTHFYGAKERYDKALDLVAQVKQIYPQIYGNDPLARAMLNTAELETRVLHSEAIKHAASILQDYQETMTVLEQLRATNTHQSESAQAIRSFATLTLALASDKRGYFERTLQLSKSAIDHYLQAIRLFQELGRETDNLRAITMNNLSFLLSLQGRSEIGQQMAEKALQMSDQNGVLYNAALARNTLARILLDLDKVSEALHQVQQARRMLEEFGSTRGLAMCAFAEGEMRRWWAYQSRNTPVTSDEQYQQAIERYTEAQRIFDESQTELIRRIEARQGLGCAYRSRGFAKYQRGEDATADMAEAIRLFNEALSLYTAKSSTPTPLITSLHEDIAVAYVNQERYTEALAALDEAQKSLPDSYTIREHEGIVDTEATREQKSYWLQLGQIELQRGICYHAQQDYHQFSAAMLRAFGCVLTFSPQAQQLFTIRSLIRPRLIDIDPLVLESIRYRTYKMANDLNLGEAFKEMDYLFDEAITFADVFQD